MPNIKPLVERLMDLHEIMYHQVAPDVTNIINNKIKDPIVIERCLDIILNIPTDKGWELLQTLTSYYRNVDEKAANEYLELYQELYNFKPKTKKRT